MAETVIGLAGDRDTDVHVPDGKTGWTASTDNTKLANARAAAARAGINNINWFAWFTVKDQSGNPVKQQQYTVTFDAPTDGGTHTFYAFDGNTVSQISTTAADNKGNKKRLKVTFSAGDPGIGIT